MKAKTAKKIMAACCIINLALVAINTTSFIISGKILLLLVSIISLFVAAACKVVYDLWKTIELLETLKEELKRKEGSK